MVEVEVQDSGGTFAGGGEDDKGGGGSSHSGGHKDQGVGEAGQADLSVALAKNLVNNVHPLLKTKSGQALLLNYEFASLGGRSFTLDISLERVFG